MPGIPHGSIFPSVSRPGKGNASRLAFVSGQQDVGLRLVNLLAPHLGDTITAHSPFCDASRFDTPGQFSPDSRQVAFASDRSGSQQIWIANVDGSGLRSMTQLQDATVSLGSWSPDGLPLAFDATIGDKTHIYHVPVGGGAVKRLTDGTATEIDPEWSRDGPVDLLRVERIGQVGDLEGARRRRSAYTADGRAGLQTPGVPGRRVSISSTVRGISVWGRSPRSSGSPSTGGPRRRWMCQSCRGHGTSPRPVSFSSSSRGWAARRTSRVPGRSAGVQLRAAPHPHARNIAIPCRSFRSEPLSHRVARREVGRGRATSSMGSRHLRGRRVPVKTTACVQSRPLELSHKTLPKLSAFTCKPP